MALGPERNPEQFFLCLDTTPVAAGSSVVQAFDVLFKSFFVFGVHYPEILSSFYEFVAAYIYEVLPFSSVRPMVRSFATAIRTIR